MKIDVERIDRHVKFLREQAARLEDLAARPGYSWANSHVKNMMAIADLLLEIRREHQMTGIGGKRLE